MQGAIKCLSLAVHMHLSNFFSKTFYNLKKNTYGLTFPSVMYIYMPLCNLREQSFLRGRTEKILVCTLCVFFYCYFLMLLNDILSPLQL